MFAVVKPYCIDIFNYRRRKADNIVIGNTSLGGNEAIRVQSMTNTNTLDTPSSVKQCIAIINAGGTLVRLTAQGVREAENLKNIHAKLRNEGYTTPLVADIHFNPKAAEVAALYVEKVRINPGNFVSFNEVMTLSNPLTEENELTKIRQKLLPLLAICKDHKTAIRIGVNHGSLSERIMNKYGNTAQGMVVSAMEFLQLCKEEGFNDVVISMKSSNTLVMMHSVRLLIAAMEDDNMHYPLHLGVTEAGDGEDGRIKSAVGIGALLADGIGDTIRVSLSEAPELEIPVAKKLIAYIDRRKNHLPIQGLVAKKFNPYSYTRRETVAVQNIGKDQVPVVFVEKEDTYSIEPDIIVEKISSYGFHLLHLSYSQLATTNLAQLANKKDTVLLLQVEGENPVGEMRACFHALLEANCKLPVVINIRYQENDVESLQVKAGADFGALLLDGFGDGIFIQNNGTITNETLNNISFGILQAARVRSSKTEYISCPGCGRTLFDLQSTIARIKAQTAHLKGLKIGIMGCIVNGPGEMADADYGYVGAGKGKVSLYKKQDCIEKNIPEEEAVEKLIALIKENGDWQ